MKRVLFSIMISSLLLTGVVFAEETATTATEDAPNLTASDATVTPPVVNPPKATTTPEKLNCMQKAVRDRDNALILAWDKYTPQVRNAYEARRAALKKAWGIKDVKKRNAAITKARKAFNNAINNAKKKLAERRKKAQDTFKAKASAECKQSINAKTQKTYDTADLGV